MPKRVPILLMCALALAIVVVEMRHEARTHFARLQALQAERDALNVEWGRLLLEEGAWSQHRRIEATARARLNMDLPDPRAIRVVHTEATRSP